MKTKHTPGPWKVILNHPNTVMGKAHSIKQDDNVECPIGLVCATTGSLGPGKGIANARLIAAAPELLEALIMARGWFGVTVDERNDPIFDVMNSAIAKATA